MTQAPNNPKRETADEQESTWVEHVPGATLYNAARKERGWVRALIGLILVLTLAGSIWGLWSNYEDTIAKRFTDEEGASAADLDRVAQDVVDTSVGVNKVGTKVDDAVARIDAGNRAATDASAQLREDLSRVAEATDTGLSEVGADVKSVLTRVDEGNQNTAELNETLKQLADSGKVIVTLSPEKLAMLRELEQPQMKLFYYDAQGSRIAFDDTSPELAPGQYMHVQFADAPGSAPTHKYLLAIKSTGDVQLYSRQLVESPDVAGDWEIDPGVDNESLLVVSSDHALTDAEQADLIAALKKSLPKEALPIRRNRIYEWRNGEIIQLARLNETRDLKRNPNAPVDWVGQVNRTLADRNLAFHGFTYPVTDESP